jgi:multiple antibiotic resistance protein
MISAIFLYLAATIGALLPIVNPLSTAPVFLAVTAKYSDQWRNTQARLAAIYMAVILLVSLFAGAVVLEFFGIGIPVLRIAGGLVITRVGFGMLEPSSEHRVLPEEEKEAQSMDNVAFTPVAMPMLAGPGAIATTIAIATESMSLANYAGVAVGICVVALIAWGALRSSSALLGVIGNTGMNVVTRLMGLILICIGIRFVVVGALEGLASEPMLEAIRAWLSALESTGG